MWLTKDPSQSDLQQQQLKTPTYEKGVYVFFDVSTWSKMTKEFVLYYEQLEDRSAVVDTTTSTSTNNNSTTAAAAGRKGIPGVADKPPIARPSVLTAAGK